MISKKYILAPLFVVATSAWASTFQYTLDAPAITTGVQQSVVFTLSFTAPDILSSTTNLITLGTLNVPDPFNPNYPTIVNANLFPTGVGSLAISFNGPPGVGTLIGSMLGSVAFDHVGSYQVNWQIVGNSTAGDNGAGTFTIADISTAPVPEPATLMLTAGGLVVAALARRRHSC